MGTVTRVSTIVEILKIWSTIFSNKNSVNCILLHKSIFIQFWPFIKNFSTFSFLKKIKLSKNALVTLGCFRMTTCRLCRFVCRFGQQQKLLWDLQALIFFSLGVAYSLSHTHGRKALQMQCLWQGFHNQRQPQGK